MTMHAYIVRNHVRWNDTEFLTNKTIWTVTFAIYTAAYEMDDLDGS